MTRNRKKHSQRRGSFGAVLSLFILIFVSISLIGGCIGIQTRPGAELIYIPILIPPTPTKKSSPDPAAVAKASTTAITSTQTISGTLTPTATGAVTNSVPLSGTMPVVGTVRPTKTAIPTRERTPTRLPQATPTRQPTTAPTKAITPKPTSTFTPAPPPEPTPLPRTIYIGRHNSFSEGSSLFVVGEVFNGDQVPINSVRVLGSFYDSSGKLVAVQEAPVVLPQSEPGMPNPFKLTILGSADKIVRYELALEWDELSIIDYQVLTIVSAEVDEGDGEDDEEKQDRKLVGLIRNHGATAVNDIIIALTLYNSEGDVVDVFQEIPRETSLVPNATTDFEILLPKDLEFEHFSIQAQGTLALF